MLTTDQRAFLSANHPDALPLIDNGWTVDSALNHVEGTCDHMLCTGNH